ncbi:hypothetical protein [Anaerotruncus colihominis]|uniref:Lipoprotein n=1 Tax=Anaerotruncus colihominis TaxID=169435 RepID=A0A845SQ60_9FIRM|nr:hypothetical protein [Anaerotruncus colihominis]MCR2024263.1 hypothetical protein [Anaerotruncus colihominis]NDO39189.1 hypothetical protein [Anaerotruncus colihominis]
MRRRIGCCILLCAALLWTGTGCARRDQQHQAENLARQSLSQNFQTTAKVRYKNIETVMTIYKKPMNCAVVTFEAPDSLKEMKMTFYTDHVALSYKDLSFDFTPDSVPGKAASKMVLTALNAALNDDGISVREEEGRLIVDGTIDAGDFSLIIDAENGNILKLSIPENNLELEVLNFKFLE